MTVKSTESRDDMSSLVILLCLFLKFVFKVRKKNNFITIKMFVKFVFKK